MISLVADHGQRVADIVRFYPDALGETVGYREQTANSRILRECLHGLIARIGYLLHHIRIAEHGFRPQRFIEDYQRKLPEPQP